MSDSTDTGSNEGGNDETSGTTPAAGGEFQPITSQDDLNKVIADRISRERAKYADYKDVKAKAAEFDKVAEANKTEIEKANDRTAKAEAEVAAIPAKVADALRAHLVELHQIDQDDAELFLTAHEPELLLKQVQRLTGRERDRKKQGNHVPREGTTPKPAQNDERAFVRGLFGG